MSTETSTIVVGGVTVQIVRKAIKNLHLGVYPPHGRVRVAAPPSVSDDAVRLAVVGKLAWIRRQQAKYAAQPRQSTREFVNGECHYYLGRRYRLRITEGDRSDVRVRSRNVLELVARRVPTASGRERILQEWYRERLRELALPMIEKWQSILSVNVNRWRIQRMKTKWGSCNPVSRSILLNLELAKKPIECIEYVVAHELAHLHERTHSERFVALLDEHLPDWRRRRAELNALPLSQNR
jgi:predicted metal-dependent hydrolase